MKLINLVYDDELDEADVLEVPDYIADNIEYYVMEFNGWLFDPENRQRFLAPYKGRMELAIGTEEFVWWLNCYHASEKEASTIIGQHTSLRHGLPVAYF